MAGDEGTGAWVEGELVENLESIRIPGAYRKEAFCYFKLEALQSLVKLHYMFPKTPLTVYRLLKL